MSPVHVFLHGYEVMDIGYRNVGNGMHVERKNVAIGLELGPISSVNRMPKGFPRLLMERVTASAQSVKFRGTLPRRLRTRRAQAQIAVGYRQVFLDVGYRLHAGMEPRVNLLALGLLSPRDCSELGITAFLRAAVARQTSRWQDAQAFVALQFAFTLGGVDLYWISRFIEQLSRACPPFSRVQGRMRLVDPEFIFL